MGLLDTIKNIFGGSEKPAQNAELALKSEQSSVDLRVSDKLLKTANVPLKASRVFTDKIYDTDENGEQVILEYSYSVSGDFSPCESHAGEIDSCFFYDPDDNEAENYDVGIILFTSCGDEAVYEAAEEFKENGKIEEAYSFEKLNDDRLLFKAKLDYYQDDIIILYGMDRGLGKTWENCGIGIFYLKELLNTPLEKKLEAAIDEAAHTYSEKIKTDE